MSEYKKSFCPLCLAECGILVKTDTTKIISIIPDKSNPVSRGYICDRPQRFVDKEDKLLSTPLKRINGELTPITWQQAISEIADKLKQYKGDDIFYFDNIQPCDWLESTYLFKFLDSLGVTAFTDIFGIEVMHKLSVEYSLMNRAKSTRLETDIANTQTLMLVGKNMWVSNHEVDARTILSDIRRDPDRNLIVVDVVRTKTAEMADYFIQIKPGTDFWFLRSLNKMLVDNDLVDWNWIKSNTTGYENINKVVDFNLTEYLNICGVDYDQLLAVAQVIGHSKTIVVKAELGVNHTPNPMANYYLLNLIWLLRASYNLPGGAIPQSTIPTQKKFKQVATLTKHTQQPCSMGGGVPAAIVPAELSHYKVLLVNQSNPINHMPGRVEFTETFNSAELKIVMDCVLTDTAQLADYVLPTPAYYQKYDITGGLTTNATNLQLKRPIYETYGQRTVYEIVNMLAEHITVEGEFTQWHSAYINSTYETPVIALLETLLKYSYPDEQVEEHIQQLVKTNHVDIRVAGVPDMKLNLALPKLDIILDNPDSTALTKDADYPFILAAGYRRKDSTGMDVLNQNRLTVEVHPEDAESLGIVEQETVCISTRSGSILAECVLNSDLQPGYIRTPTNKHLNMLTTNNIQDKLNPMYKINHARIDKVDSN